MKKKVAAWLLLMSLIVAVALPAQTAAVISDTSGGEVSARQQEIAVLLEAIDIIKNNKGLSDDIRTRSITDLLDKLKPLLNEEIGYLFGQRDIVLSNETNETAKGALKRTFDSSIGRLKDIQISYSLENLLNNDSGVSPNGSQRSVRSGGANSDTPYTSETARPINRGENTRTAEYTLSSTLNKKGATSSKAKRTAGGKNNDDDPPPPPTTNSRIRPDAPIAGQKIIRGTVTIDSNDGITTPAKIKITATGKDPKEVAVIGNSFPFSIVLSEPLTTDQAVSFQLFDSGGNEITYATVTSRVFTRVDPTIGGLFGVLYAGVVTSRQAQTVNEAAPFMGFQVGWGSSVTGVRRSIGNPALNFTGDCTAAEVAAGTNHVEYDTLVFNGTTFYRVEDEDGMSYQPLRPVATGGQPCTVKFNRGKNPFTGWGTHRTSFRFQGMFSNEGRAAIATPTESPLPVGQPNRPFPFIHHRESFSPEFTVWREWNPLGKFSAGLYITVGGTTALDSNTTEDQLITDRETNFRLKSNVSSNGGTKIYAEFGTIKHLKFNPGKFLLQNFSGFGYYEAYRGTKYKFGSCGLPTGCQLDGNTRFRFIDKLRVFPEGLSVNFGHQITGTPVFGIDINAGAGPDNIRFFTGFAIRLKSFDGKTVDDK